MAKTAAFCKGEEENYMDINKAVAGRMGINFCVKGASSHKIATV